MQKPVMTLKLTMESVIPMKSSLFLHLSYLILSGFRYQLFTNTIIIFISCFLPIHVLCDEQDE